MKRCGWVLLFMGLFAACYAHAGNVIWTNISGGNWSTGKNWKAHQSPGSADTAFITNAGSYTVTLDISPTITSLVLGRTNGSGAQILSANSKTFKLTGTATIATSGVLSGTGYSGIVFSGTLIPAGGTFLGDLTIATNSILNLTTPAA